MSSSADSPSDVVTLPAGTRLSDTYEIESHIALGGMAEVYRAHNVHTEEPVAIKLVLPAFAHDETILALFKKEATILSRLRHDAIVHYHLFTVEREMQRPYLVMEFVDGMPLSDRLQQGPLPPEEVRKMLLRVASGLQTAHAVGVIHRDLSPDNVILPDGRMDQAKIIDFGIAKSANVGGGTLLEGKFAGKYNFVSPEQLGLFGGEVTAQSDIYSLGLIAAAALLGRPLDMSGSHVEVIEKRRAVPDLGGVGAELRPVLTAMLQPRPEDRPRDMAAVVTMLTAPPVSQKTVVRGREPAPTTSLMPPGGAAREPTQMAPAQPPAGQYFDPARPVTLTSESPFGPYVAADKPATPPVSPAAVAVRKRKRGFPFGLLVSIVVVVLAGLGVAGYGEGWFGKGWFGAVTAPQPIAAPTHPATSTAPPPAQVSVKPPATTVAGAPVATPALPAEMPATMPPVATPAHPAEIPVTTPPVVTPPASGQSAPQAPAVAQKAEPEPSEPAIPIAEPSPPVVTGGQPETTTPAAEVDDAARRVAWLNSYGFGPCQYASVVSISEAAMAIEAFGNSEQPFEALNDEFARINGFAPDIGLRLINDSQCPVADFLRAARSVTQPGPVLDLDTDSIANGQSLHGTLSNAAGWTTALFLVDSEGNVHDVTDHLAKSAAAGTIDLAVTSDASKAVPMLLVAVSGKAGNQLGKLTASEPASSFFPDLLKRVAAQGGDAAVTVRYFKAGAK